MFERYTEKARRVILFARYEASQFGSPYIETEHLLLGLVREDLELINRFIAPAASDGTFRELTEAHTLRRPESPTGVDLPFSNECKRVLAYSAEEAERLGHKHIGTEHLLLGLLCEEGGFAARLLRERGADLKDVQKELAAAPRAVALYPDRSKLAEFSAGYRSQSDSDPRINFETYTEKARRSILSARYEASAFGAERIETEHLLLGMWREAPWVINGLMELKDPWESLRKQIEEHTNVGKRVSTSVDMPLSEELKRVLMYATEEAEGLMHRTIEVEHLLLGLLREEGCVAAQLLRERGADLVSFRKKLMPAAPPDSEGSNPT